MEMKYTGQLLEGKAFGEGVLVGYDENKIPEYTITGTFLYNEPHGICTERGGRGEGGTYRLQIAEWKAFPERGGSYKFGKCTVY